MSRETIGYLNAGNILIGNGVRSWWYRAEMEDPNNPTHYAGPIPVEDVRRRLFGWKAVESTSLMATVQLPDGDTMFIDCADKFKAIIREDTGQLLTVAGKNWTPHQYGKTLLDTTSTIIGDTLVVDSAGLLQGGAKAWVQVSVTEDMHNTESGFNYRPKLLGWTSLDGTTSTGWKRVCRFVQCDNTFDMAMLEPNNGIFKRRHTVNSLEGIELAARTALGLVERTADAMDEALTEMIRTEVTKQHFDLWMDEIAAIPAEGSSPNSITMAENRRNKLVTMWTSDERVAPWAGTKLGALQLVNTFSQHESIIRGVNRYDGNMVQARVERTMLNVLNGRQAKNDSNAMATLDKILEAV